MRQLSFFKGSSACSYVCGWFHGRRYSCENCLIHHIAFLPLTPDISPQISRPSKQILLTADFTGNKYIRFGKTKDVESMFCWSSLRSWINSKFLYLGRSTYSVRESRELISDSIRQERSATLSGMEITARLIIGTR